MKEKIYNKLKQEYSSLGLGENVLQAQAESLATSGIVTDENMDAVIKAQKPFLEVLQKQSDKRVSDAQKKAKEDAKKEFEEDAKKKAEEEAKKAEEARKQKEEEDKKKAEEEAKKKAEEEAERKRLEALKKAEVPEWYLKEREEREKKAKEQHDAFTALIQELREGRKKDNDEFTKTLQEMQDKNQKLIDDYDKLQKENEDAKKLASIKQRQDYILNKAKELGIPQDRIDEGFVIKDDADESAINDFLSKVSSNIKTRQLPKDKHFQKADANDAKEVVDEVVKSMVR